MGAQLRGTIARQAPSPLTRLRRAASEFAASSPSRFAITIFTALILALTALLMLPFSSADGTITPLADAVFTAVSTICVTGLTTVDMATHWSPLGNVFIVVGLQVGGIGVLTLASIMGLVVSRRLGLRQRLIAASDSNPLRLHHGPVVESQAVRLGEIGGLLITVAVSVLIIEAALTVFITPRLLLAGADPWTALWQGFYYATSAFTNTGFTPNTGGIEPFATDPWMLSVLAIGVFLGALGFPVIFALARGWRTPRKWSVHVKLTLTMTLALIVLGAIAFLALEFNNPDTLGRHDGGAAPFTSLFMSVMSRSGGFATVPLSEANGSTLLVLDMLMFVGGGSASTAGGIKVTTLAVLFLAAWAEARGVSDMQAFERRIPNDVLRLSVSVVLWGSTIVATASIILMHMTKAPLDVVLFDVISAFATCGLSSGFTESVPDAGKYVLAATMWAGRVGTVTLAAALAAKERRQLFRRAEERPIVG